MEALVLSQQQLVNSVRSGRKQPQRVTCVPRCGWGLRQFVVCNISLHKLQNVLTMFDQTKKPSHVHHICQNQKCPRNPLGLLYKPYLIESCQAMLSYYFTVLTYTLLKSRLLQVRGIGRGINFMWVGVGL